MATETNAPVSQGEIVTRPYITVMWQKGLQVDGASNGCRVDDVLHLVQEKLQSYQEGPLACQENDDALQAVRAALSALEARRTRRKEQGVFNTMDAHESERTEDVEEDFSATGA